MEKSAQTYFKELTFKFQEVYEPLDITKKAQNRPQWEWLHHRSQHSQQIKDHVPKGSWLNVLSTSLKGHSDISSLYESKRVHVKNSRREKFACASVSIL